MKFTFITHKIAALFIMGVFAVVAPSTWADTPAASPAPQAAPATVAKVDYKDAFLGFVLEKAQKYSGTVEDTIGKAVDVAKTEAPVLAHEYLVWQAWYHATYIVLPLVLFTVFFWTFLKQWPKWTVKITSGGYYKDDDWSLSKGSIGNVAATIIGGIISLISFIAFFANLDHLLSFIQILVAPRVYILEQVIHLVK